jgi:hypothetical protein
VRRLTLIVVLFLAALFEAAPAQDKKKEKKIDPQIMVLAPLGAAPGKTTKITIRGLRLDQAKEVNVSGGGSAKISSKGGAPVPDKNPEKVGDTQVVAEITLPAKVEGEVLVTVVTPDGPTKPQPLLVEQKLPVIAENEPNPGFKQAQAITLPVVIEGVIASPRDVDVFRFEGKKGQKVSAEVLARRFGSPLDALLSLYNERGELLAHAESAKGDPRFEATLPADGVFFLSLIDANDTGSSVHVYRLRVEAP